MRILIIGQCTLHWGRMEFGNIGNYYIIEPLMRGLHEQFPDAEIVTTMQLSQDFCERENIKTLEMDLYYGWTGHDLAIAEKELAIAKEFKSTGVLKETTPYIDEVQKSDLVIDFSGDIWGDNANFLGDDRFLVGLYKDKVAQLMGKLTAMIAGSPGPFGSPKTAEIAKDVFAGFDLVTNREPVSTALLKELGFDVSKTVSLACPSFKFEPSEDKMKINHIFETEGIAENKKPIVGFVLCGWNFKEAPFDKWPREDSEYTVFAEAIEHLVSLGAKVVLMSHANGFDVPPAPFVLRHGRDYPIIKQLQKVVLDRGKISDKDLISLDGVYDAWDTKAIIGKFDMLVSGRVHAAVAGLSQCVPTVIIDYGHEPKAHKLMGFAELTNMGHMVADPSVSQSLKNKINDCWKNRERITNELKTLIPHVQDMAKENFVLLKKLVKSQEEA